MALRLQTLGRSPANAGPMVRSVVFDGFDYAIRFAYHAGSASVLRADPFKARYVRERNHRLHEHWRIARQVVENAGIDLITALCTASGRNTSAELPVFEERIRAAAATVQPAAFTADLAYSIYTLELGAVALVGTYHPATVVLARSMRATFLAPMKAWKFAGTSAEMLRENLLRELMLAEHQVRILEGTYGIVDDAFAPRSGTEGASIRTFNNAIPEAGAGATEEHSNELYLAQPAPLAPSGLSSIEIDHWIGRYPSLFDFQQGGVRHLLVQNSALLADDMGLGKSRQAVVAMHIRIQSLAMQGGATQVLIVCPTSLVYNWVKEIRMVVPDATIATESYREDAQWVVTSYGRLADMVQHAPRFSVMAIDEAHFLKEPTAARTRHAFDVAVHIETRFLLTATPILNRETELHTLLRLSGHPLGNIPLRDFEKRFTGDSAFRAELRQAISKWVLRRKKSLVLKSLKGKQVQPVYVRPTEELRASYDAVANDSTLLPLPKITKLRMLLEQIKVDNVLQMIDELGPEDKFLIFCEYKETVQLFKSRLAARGKGCVTLLGSDSSAKRQRAVDQFQEDEDIDGFAGTTAAAGVGYTMTKANYVFFPSLPWTPALKNQAEDRAYRIGQLRMVVVKIPLVENSIDDDLMQMLGNKEAIAADVLEDPEEAERLARERFAAQFAKKAA